MATNSLISQIVAFVLVFVSKVVSECETYKTALNDEINLGCLSGLVYLYNPWTAEKINPSYLVFDQLNRKVPTHLLSWKSSFRSSDHVFDENEKIVFIVHGFSEHGNEEWMHNLKDAYLNRTDSGPMKVISVDWSTAANGATWLFNSDYVQAATNARMVGRITASFIRRLMLGYRIAEQNVHLIGHSLGSHVVGETMAWLHEKYNVKVGRVTALDAASPLFEWLSVIPNRNHTHFLEAVHTSAKISITQYFYGAVGLALPFGHVDYYPNGGILYQPACRKNNSFYCSHRRGYIYYTDILARCTEFCDFKASRCKNFDEATAGKCSGNKIRGWHYANAAAPSAALFETNNILHFETDGDRMKIVCEPNDNQFEENRLIGKAIGKTN